MASNTENHGYFPQRSENILANETHPGYPRDEIEQLERHDRNASDRSSSLGQDADGAALETTDTYTSSSGEERTFEPITSEDRAQLQKIASTFGGSVALARSNTGASSKLERRDTLAGVELGDPVLDPASPEFNVYKWARMYDKIPGLKLRPRANSLAG
jgi:ATP-binding cassette, subfamily G (WHITE), member 2, PDR